MEGSPPAARVSGGLAKSTRQPIPRRRTIGCRRRRADVDARFTFGAPGAPDPWTLGALRRMLRMIQTASSLTRRIVVFHGSRPVRVARRAALLLWFAMGAAACATGGEAIPAPERVPYTAEEVRIPTSDGYALAGTLTLPANSPGPHPVVVLISGSGLNDRDHRFDENREIAQLLRVSRLDQPDSIPYHGFREIADTLSRRGIAVLRFDDPGYGSITSQEHFATTTRERADDTRAALTYLRGRPEIDRTRIGLLGLSEGGLIAPMIAAEDSAIAALVLMAAPAEAGRTIMDYWARYAADRAEGASAAERNFIYAAGRNKIAARFSGMRWTEFFRDYDPIPAAREIRAPVLILHGANDGNVPPGNARRLDEAIRAAGNHHVTIRIFPGLNHLFIEDPDGRQDRFDQLPSWDVASEVLGAVADWTVLHLEEGTKVASK